MYRSLCKFCARPLEAPLTAVWSWCGQSERDESRTASKPCCVGLGDGAGGGALVGLDSDAGLTLLSDRGASS